MCVCGNCYYVCMCQGGGKPDTGKLHSSYIGTNVCGSAYENGCVVNGTCAMIEYYHYMYTVYVTPL